MNQHLFVFIILIALLNSCAGSGEIKDGSTAYAAKKYELAQQLLPAEISKASNETKYTKMLQLAKSYAFANKVDAAESWFEKLYNESGRDEHLFLWAKSQKSAEMYQEALDNFLIYKEKTRDIFYSSPEIIMCKEALNFDSETSSISIENEDKLNSSSYDYLSFITEDIMYISSSRAGGQGENKHPWTGEQNGDIWSYGLSSKTTTDGQKIIEDAVNTEFPEGSITISKDGKTAYFGRCDFGEEITGYCHIYKTELVGSAWSEPEMLSLFGDTNNVGQPYLANNDTRLYFAGNTNFGFGGNDIYFMEKLGNDWSEPYNAGFSVNTEGEELFPTTDTKGNLYFSSNGRTGYGGLDIFKVQPLRQNFSKSIHLPYPINSGGDDFGLLYQLEPSTSNDKKGGELLEMAYFSSSRKDGKGYDDIYSYRKVLKNYFELLVNVQEKEFENPEDGKSDVIGLIALEGSDVTVTNVLTNEEQKATTDETGQLLFQLEAESDYKIFAAKNGYFNKSVSASTKDLNDVNELLIRIERELELEKIFPETEITIPNIYYDLDKANLRAESLPVLDTLVSFFEENSDLTIEIGSHTDSRGSDKYNEDLSQRRAQSVVDYLISRGVTSKTLVAKGYGEYRLTNRCANDVECSEEEHQANRRTTFKVISADGVLESE